MKSQGTQESYELYGIATAESVKNTQTIASDISTIRHQEEDEVIMEDERHLLKDGSKKFISNQKVCIQNLDADEKKLYLPSLASGLKKKLKKTIKKSVAFIQSSSMKSFDLKEDTKLRGDTNLGTVIDLGLPQIGAGFARSLSTVSSKQNSRGTSLPVFLEKQKPAEKNTWIANQLETDR